MDSKEYLTNKSFCPIPWTGMYVHPDGAIRNCVVSYEDNGNLIDQNLQDILHGEKTKSTKQQMLNGQTPYTCKACYDLEVNTKLSGEMILKITFAFSVLP